MKRIAAFVILFLGFGMLFSQSTRTMKMGDFSSLKVFDGLIVKLIYSKEPKLEISGSHKDDVEVIFKNGELKLRMSTLKFLKGKDTTIKLYYNKLNNIQSSEGSEIISSESIVTKNLSINVKAGGAIKLDVIVEQLLSRVTSGGSITVKGKADNQDVSVSAGGSYNAEKVESKNVLALVRAGGNINVTAKDKVDAKAIAGGNINIYGKPSQVVQKTTVGGSINLY